MLAEESSERFFNESKQLLESDNVRFHIKHLVLELMGMQDKVNAELYKYCLVLHNETFWSEHIFNTVFLNHPHFINFLINEGVINKCLNSKNDNEINRAFMLLQSVVDKIPDVVANVLEPHVKKENIWIERILNSMSWKIENDSDNLFQIRLKLARLGHITDYIDWESICNKHSLRAVELIEAFLSSCSIDNDSKVLRKKRMEKWYDKDSVALNETARKFSVETWDHLMLHIERLTNFETKTYDSRMHKWRNYRSKNRKYEEISRGVVELLIIAGQTMVSDNPDKYMERISGFEGNKSIIIKEIIIEIYKNLPRNHADIGIKWLLSDLLHFRIGSGCNEPEWQPAVRLIKALSPYCSARLFNQLEETIIQYHSPDEKEEAEYFLKNWQKGYSEHYWGKTQYFLLPALAKERTKPKTDDLIRVLNRKFANYPKISFLSFGPISGGSIGSKLDPSLEKISDQAWLNIINNKKIEKNDNHKWIQVSPDQCLTTSVSQFVRSLEKIAKRYPERFARLSLNFTSDTDSHYIAAIINCLGLKKPDSEVPKDEIDKWEPAKVETVEAVLSKFKGSNDRETAMAFCNIIAERADENWPDEVISKVVHFAKEHPDPEPDKLHIYCDRSANDASIEILFQNTIKCVRGVAAHTISRLLWEHYEWLDKLRPGIESLINDHHPAVRMASIEILIPIINIDKDQAVKWFLIACNNDLRVAASPRAKYFYKYIRSDYIDSIAPVIQKMTYSQIDDVAKEGAIQISASWLFYGYFKEVFDCCLKGTIPQREGVATVIASPEIFYDVKYTNICQDILLSLLNDPAKNVREELIGLFRQKDDLSDCNLKPFILKYIKSKTFYDDPDIFIDYINDFTGNIIFLEDMIFAMCNEFTSTLKDSTRDISLSFSFKMSDIFSILLRLYKHALKEGNMRIANRCLDIFDEFFLNRIGIAGKLINALEQ